MSTTRRIALLITALATTACTVQETPAPSTWTGPSELALRIAMQVVPDSILQDGASQAALSIEAGGPDGRPVRGLPLRVEVMYDGIVQDFGTLSSKSVVTGEDGRARVTYTAPPRPSQPVEQGNRIVLRVIPIGSDYQGEVSREVELRLVTPGLLLPPNSAPQPSFTFSPSTPLPLTDIIFDASGTTDEGVTCGASCTYRWEFGDGTTATGIFGKHQYKTLGNYQVRLTATDARGASGTIAQSMSIGAGIPPTAAFTFSPTTVNVGQTVFFNAEGSKAAAGRRIVSYDWDFGSGATASGITASRSFSVAAPYVVTLVVTDDAGEKHTATNTVTVGAGTAFTAALKATPETTIAAPATTSTTFIFDASSSISSTRIVDYRFNFGDGSPAVSQTFPSREYRYATRGIYVVSVTIRDSAGRTDTAQVTVYVQ